MSRFRIESIPPAAASMYRDIGVQEGDILDAPAGFPPGPDLDDPGEPVILNHRIGRITIQRRLHPNVAWFVGASIEKGQIEAREEVAR